MPDAPQHISLFVFFWFCARCYRSLTTQRIYGLLVSIFLTMLCKFLFGILLMYSALLGNLLGQYAFGSGKIDLRIFQAAMNTGRLPDGVNWFVFVAVLAAVVGLIAATLLRTDVSLIDLLSGAFSSEEYRALRDDYGQATNFSNSWLLRLAGIARFGILPLLIYTLFFLKERSWIWWAAFMFVTGLGIVVGVLSGEKSPALYLLIGLVVAFYLRKGWGV